MVGLKSRDLDKLESRVNGTRQATGPARRGWGVGSERRREKPREKRGRWKEGKKYIHKNQDVTLFGGKGNDGIWTRDDFLRDKMPPVCPGEVDKRTMSAAKRN